MIIETNSTLWAARNLGVIGEMVDVVGGGKNAAKVLRHIGTSAAVWKAVEDWLGITRDELILRYAKYKGLEVENLGGVYTVTPPGKVFLVDNVSGLWEATTGEEWYVLTGDDFVLGSEWFGELLKYAGEAAGKWTTSLERVVTGVWQVGLTNTHHSAISPVEKLTGYLESGGSPVRQRDGQRLVTIPSLKGKTYDLGLLAGKVK